MSGQGAAAPPVLRLMNQRNVWAEEGLKVEFTEFQSSTLTVAALMAGELDFAMGEAGGAVNAALKGADLRVIGIFQDKLDYHFIGGKEIRSIQDLRGRVVGIARIGSSADFATRLLLRRNGLEPDRDVALLQVGNSPERVAALQAGGIQAALMSADVQPLLAREGFPDLADLSKTDIRYPFGAVAASQSLLGRRPELADSVLRALYRGIKLFRDDPDTAQRLFAEQSPELLPTKEAVQVVWETWRNVFTTDLAPEPEIFGLLLQVLALETPGAESAAPAQYLEPRFVQQINASVFRQILFGAP
jgi:ABC-type nitrate/sulfonate/bicarbonate transport system substrate-binding protein